MISLIIPAYYATKELEEMTKRCVKSAGNVDEIIVQVDPTGEGYVSTTNKGLRRAKGDILIVGNNDLIFPKNWLEELLMPLDNGYDIATCWTSDQDNIVKKETITEGTRFGSLLAMTRQVYEATNGFDPLFRDYFGDVDLQKRAEDMGYTVGRNDNLVVEHLAKATYKTVDSKDDRFIQGMRIFESKYGYVE